MYGSCVEDNGAVSCECELGWGGPFCNEPIPVVEHCDPNPCVNGTCQNQNDGFSCECGLGWDGPTCEDEVPIVERCDPNPCINGVCENRSTSFECECSFGWTGTLCDEEVLDPCDPNPCQEGACVPSVEGATCECFPGYTGPKCNQPISDVCSDNPCVNGTCEGTLLGAVCDCDPGFTGATCEVAITDPCSPNPCVNGVCEADGEQARCECFSGYEGATCATPIPNHPTNPILFINDCSVELVSPLGWTNNGDGTYTSGGGIGLNLGGTVLPLSGPSITFDSNQRSFSGSFEALPLPAMDFLAGAGFGFSASDFSTSAVLTGAQIKTALGDSNLPLPDGLELLAFSLNAPRPRLALNGAGNGLTVDVDDAVGIGFYLDPCDPLAYLWLSDAIVPAVGPVQLTSFGASIDKHLLQASQVELWDGENTAPRSLAGHAYLSGILHLEAISNIPIEIAGSALVDVDPNRDGTIDPDMFAALFTTGDVAAVAADARDTASDFGLLSNGVVSPALPFVAGELATFFQDEFGLRLDLANGSLLYDSSALYFRGISDANPFRDTVIGSFVPQNPTLDIMGYARGPIDWGLRFSTMSHFISGGPGYQATFQLVVNEHDPSLTIATQIDFGTIDFIPGITIPLGSVPITFGVDFATGDVCGMTGYDGADFSCTIEVCVGGSGFDFNPSCELPSGFLCVDDSMCISNSCENLIPESGCADGCDAVRVTCEGACDATRATCDGTCTATEATCTGTCDVAFDTCDTGCLATDAVCNGTCDATGTTCRGVCDAAEETCDVGCQAAQATCDGACNAAQGTCNGACDATGAACRAPCDATQATCSAGCSAAQGACNGACDATFAACDAGCWVGTGTCDATYETCRAGCVAACHCWTVCAPWPFDDECWSECTCDRNACIDSCAGARDSCRNAIVAPCRNACASTRDNCKGGCNNTLGSCNSTCASTGNGCRGACNSAESSCNGACTAVGNDCRNGCAGGLASCSSTCASTGDSCRGPCNSAQATCEAGCDTATANCEEECTETRQDCVGPCQGAGNDCHAGCGSAFDDCASPCETARDGCVDGCELVGTCE